MENGYEGHYLKFTNNGRDVGLLLVNMDYTYMNDFRAYIRHITTIDNSIFETAVKLGCEFIW